MTFARGRRWENDLNPKTCARARVGCLCVCVCVHARAYECVHARALTLPSCSRIFARTGLARVAHHQPRGGAGGKMTVRRRRSQASGRENSARSVCSQDIPLSACRAVWYVCKYVCICASLSFRAGPQRRSAHVSETRVPTSPSCWRRRRKFCPSRW